MHADQDPRGLLLLRLRAAGLQAAARVQLRQHGAGHDRGDQVRKGATRKQKGRSKTSGGGAPL